MLHHHRNFDLHYHLALETMKPTVITRKNLTIDSDLLNQEINLENEVISNILNDAGTKIGQWSWRELCHPEELFPHHIENEYSAHFALIEADIRAKIPSFPVAELRNLEIYDELERGKGYGRKTLYGFFELARSAGYSHAIVEIGKLSLDTCIEESTKFYARCGWTRFVTPTEYSPRFAYFDLALS